MSKQHKIEIYSAGCPLCQSVVQKVKEKYGDSSDVLINNVNDKSVASQAKDLGVSSVPAIVVDGKLADCCIRNDIDIDNLLTEKTLLGDCCCSSE